MSILKACSNWLVLTFLLTTSTTAFSQKGYEKFIGTWFCIMTDCPNQPTRFEILADNSLKIYQTLVFEKPNFYHMFVGNDFSRGTWKVTGDSLILANTTSGVIQKFTYNDISGQPFLVLITKEKCKWYLVSKTGKNKLL
ncbi:hypothetical protein [Chitinophaga polysaccharea]|uniref:hypothetical protein n=1 Tax=Chitinophaga polysaccharea TaxID=1293035 RepID=UPI001156E0DD|nr:hypothetical protein [Chitinophaga polysaccharea]